MSGDPSLPLALRWLAEAQGLSGQELAVRSGVSPAAVEGFWSRPQGALQTWCLLLRTCHCRLELRAPQATYGIALPRVRMVRRAQARRAWEARRLVAFRAQARLQAPASTSPAAIDATARSWLASSISRIDADLAAADGRLAGAAVTTTVPGFRSAIREVVRQAQVNAEDLALLAGVSLNVAATAVAAKADGQLAIAHRLFSAVNARLAVLPAGGGQVMIALAPPGQWRPAAPRPGFSSLSRDEILARLQAGVSQSEVAREANVSRQRISYLVKQLN